MEFACKEGRVAAKALQGLSAALRKGGSRTRLCAYRKQWFLPTEGEEWQNHFYCSSCWEGWRIENPRRLSTEDGPHAQAIVSESASFEACVGPRPGKQQKFCRPAIEHVSVGECLASARAVLSWAMPKPSSPREAGPGRGLGGTSVESVIERCTGLSGLDGPENNLLTRCLHRGHSSRMIC